MAAPLNPNDDTLALMVHVTAPASLPAGYTFEAQINGDPEKVFTCEVPSGGVEEGQIFLAPLPHTYDGPRLQAPVGAWKDGICDWWYYGIFHPSLWCSLCCTQVATGQVMSRMQLTWLGDPGPLVQTSTTFKVVVALVCSYYTYSTALQLASIPFYDEDIPQVIVVMKMIGNSLFTLWAVYSMCRTRQNVRARYQIQEHCFGFEDLCCSLFCSCCTAAQMLRHTGDYEHYPATCCTPTGHPPGTPLVV